jgi:quercetin dioxygenase-like cupin family protein
MESWDLTTLDIEVHKPAVLLSEEGVARAIAVNLPAGDMLQDHEVHEHAYLYLVSGELEIDHPGGTETAGPGFVAHFEPQERHEVRAKQDSRFLLLLAPWPGDGHPSRKHG